MYIRIILFVIFALFPSSFPPLSPFQREDEETRNALGSFAEVEGKKKKKINTRFASAIASPFFFPPSSLETIVIIYIYIWKKERKVEEEKATL